MSPALLRLPPPLIVNFRFVITSDATIKHKRCCFHGTLYPLLVADHRHEVKQEVPINNKNEVVDLSKIRYNNITEYDLFYT